MTRSLRRALAVRFAATMALALALASGAIFWVASGVLLRQLDDALEAAALLSGEVPAGTPGVPESGQPGADAHHGHRYVAVREAGGRVRASFPAVAAELPLDAGALRAAGTGVTVWRSDPWRGGEIRSAYARVAGGGAAGRIVQVATSLAPIRATQRDLLAALGAIGLFGTLVTFWGAWGLARSAVRPVAEITEQATQVEVGTLDHRIAAHADTEEYQGLVRVLNRMLERLDLAFRTQRRLTADVSHELRSPLTALRGEVEVALRSERQPREYQRVLRSSLEEIDRMIELTEELLLVGRAEAHLLHARPETTDVNAVVRRALDGLRPRVDQKRLRVEQALAAPVAPVDPELFARLVERLLDNAVKFAPAGGCVRVATEAHRGGVRLTVEDSGSGIAPEDLPHLFEPFYRADQARTSGSGTGLGLTVAAAVARLHGGTIEAGNRPAGGARFQVDLPASQPA